MTLSLKNLRKDKYVIALIAILVVSIAIKIYLLQFVTTGHVQDDYWMITLGRNFFSNYAYELVKGQPYDKTQPVYPFLLGLSIKLLNPFISNYNWIGAILAIVLSSILIILTYIFWKDIENKKIAIIASFFMAFSWFSVVQSLRMSPSTTFALSLLVALFFIYKSLENDKYFLITAVFITISALTRWEGYSLVGVWLISLVIARKEQILKQGKIDLGLFKKDYFIIAAIIILIPLFLWSFRSHNCCGSWIPSYGYQKQLSSGVSGIQKSVNYFKGIPEYIPYPMIFLILGGLYLGIKKYKKHYPILLSIAFILFIHLKFRGRSGHIYLINPLLYGYASIFLLKLKESIDKKFREFKNSGNSKNG